ncbi:MAG: glycosyl hydrolase family 65 protein, partial [Candidatus Margulisiibacteriota bacterium]
MRVRRGLLNFDPWLPKKWKSLSYSCTWRRNLLKVEITHRYLTLILLSGKEKTVTVKVQDKIVKLKEKVPTKIRLKKVKKI